MSNCCKPEALECLIEKSEFRENVILMFPPGLLWKENKEINPLYSELIDFLTEFYYNQQKLMCSINAEYIPSKSTKKLREWWSLLEKCIPFNFFKTNVEKQDFLDFKMNTLKKCTKLHYVNQVFKYLNFDINISVRRVKNGVINGQKINACNVIDIDFPNRNDLLFYGWRDDLTCRNEKTGEILEYCLDGYTYDKCIDMSIIARCIIDFYLAEFPKKYTFDNQIGIIDEYICCPQFQQDFEFVNCEPQNIICN